MEVVAVALGENNYFQEQQTFVQFKFDSERMKKSECPEVNWQGHICTPKR